MIPKGSKLHSIFTGSCPKCHLESMYLNKNPYNPTETLKMHEHCSYCKTKYSLEPSFFYGSMYVSYAVGIAFAVAAFIISYFILKSSLTIGFISIVVVLIAFSPIIMRLSRNIWINLFVKYDRQIAKEASKKISC